MFEPTPEELDVKDPIGAREMSEIHRAVSYRLVPNFPAYRVGDDGSVWTRWKQVFCGNERIKCVLADDWRPLKLQIDHLGYCFVGLRNDGKRKGRKVHQLVLEAFVGPRPLGAHGCHFPDPARSNNRLENLRWGTPMENAKDRDAHGTTARGEKHGSRKLTREQVAEIRRRFIAPAKRYARGNGAALAIEFGISGTYIRKICRGEIWCDKIEDEKK